jgi:hypothetical protein
MLVSLLEGCSVEGVLSLVAEVGCPCCGMTVGALTQPALGSL